MKKIAFIASAVVALSAVSAFAADNTVSTADKPISIVYDASEIAMAPLPGNRQNMGFEADPAFFQGAELCVVGLNENWAVKRDGTFDTNDPARRMSCAPIGPDGQASVVNPFGPDAVPIIKGGDRLLGWAGRDRLRGLRN